MAEPFLRSVKALATGLGVAFTHAQKTALLTWLLREISALSLVTYLLKNLSRGINYAAFFFAFTEKVRASEFYTDASKSAGAAS